MVFDVSLLSFLLFVFDPKRFRLLIFASIRVNQQLYFLLLGSVWLVFFLFFTSYINNVILSVIFFSSSSFSQTFLHQINLLLLLFWVLLNNFTKFAICQGHSLHFAICCKINWREVVHLIVWAAFVPCCIFVF